MTARVVVGSPGLGGTGGAGGEAAPSLDSRRNKSPRGRELVSGTCFLVPQFSGGRLDPIGGRKLQIRDVERIKVLERAMRGPALLTLTIDRRRFASPEEAYDYAMPRISRLLSERLGARTWFRVFEVQTASGDGWIHWHVLVDLAEVGRIGDVARRIWYVWNRQWEIGGCDLRRIRRSAAGYLARYVLKKWSAVPPWMGESTRRFRLTGASKRAVEILRAFFGDAARSSGRHSRDDASKPRRSTRTLFERLAASGTTCAVLFRNGRGATRYLDTIRASHGDIATVLGHDKCWLRPRSEGYATPRAVGSRLVLEIPTGCTPGELRERIESLNTALDCCGVLAFGETRYRKALEWWTRSWERREPKCRSRGPDKARQRLSADQSNCWLDYDR